MKILLYSDLHFRENGSFIPWNKPEENGLTGELNNIIRGCTFVADMIEALKPDYVFNHGDIFHSMETIGVRALHGAHLGLSVIKEKCVKLGIPRLLICGNHDIYAEATQICSTSILTGYFDEIFVSPTIYQDKIGVVPYYSKPEQAYEVLTEVIGGLPKTDSVILTHLEFSGAKFENNHETDAILSPEISIPAISGHIHLPQQVGNVLYIGSLVQHRFSQYGLNENGLLLYDTETKEKTRFSNTYSKHYVIVKDLDMARNFDPQKVILKVFSDQSQEEVEKVLQGYEYAYFPVTEKKDGIQESVIDFGIESPLDALKAHISQENPEALEIFEKIVKGRKGK